MSTKEAITAVRPATIPITDFRRLKQDSGKYPNNINLWERTIDEATLIRDLTNLREWEIHPTFGVNKKFPGTYSIGIKPTDKIIYAEDSLLVISNEPDSRNRNRNLRFYDTVSQSPFLTISINDAFMIVGESYNFNQASYKNKTAELLRAHINNDFIYDIFLTLDLPI
jgi:hypothetical protein